MKIAKYNSGDKFGRCMLTGKSYIPPRDGKRNGERVVEYVCDCGTIKWARLEGLKRAATTSCGCYREEVNISRGKTKGLVYHPLYKVHSNILRRCYHEHNPDFKWYGAVGVTMCDEWRNDFNSFYNWCISNGWQKGLELDKDKLSPSKTGKVYSPEFCCFITRKENLRHTSLVKSIEYDNRIQNLTAWCEELGIDYKKASNRIKLGWDIKDVFTNTKRKRPSRKNVVTS